MHYARLRKSGTTDDLPRKNASSGALCSHDGCVAVAIARGLCDNHYRQRRQKNQRSEARAAIERRCAQCDGLIPVERILRGPVSYCSSACKMRAHRESGAAAEANLRAYYKRRYGLTTEEAEALRLDAPCAICGTTDFGGRHGNGHIDHDHVTGRVRGILCTNCNTGLGQFKDDPALLRAAAEYLERRAGDATVLAHAGDL